MIISDKYRYIFIELPLTASTAIAKELITHYEGKEILTKHANYLKFLKYANEDQKRYYCFSGVRNPLDKAVSHYFKYVSDHKGRYSRPPGRPAGVGRLKYLIDSSSHSRKFNYVTDGDISFEDFFMHFYRIPYSDWSLLHHKKMDSVIFFENVVEDLDRTLKDIGIDPVRPLPRENKTALKERSFWDYYNTDAMRKKAAQIFGPYMKYWGYSFPEEWRVDQFSRQRLGTYYLFNMFKHVYWRL